MKARARNQAGKALTAEFAVALTVFLLITMFPLINLIGFAMGAGTQYLMTVQCAGGAGASTSFTDALSAMDREAVLFANSGFSKFANLQPVGGHNGTGTDLYLIETNLTGSNNVLSYGPNTGGPTPLNQNANVYEYQVRSAFDVGPFLSMSSMPWIGNVPGIGRPARLSFVAHRNCEFTEGLAMGATGSPVVASPGGGGSSGGAGGAGPTILATGPSVAGPTTILAQSSSSSARQRARQRSRQNSRQNSSGGSRTSSSGGSPVSISSGTTATISGGGGGGGGSTSNSTMSGSQSQSFSANMADPSGTANLTASIDSSYSSTNGSGSSSGSNINVNQQATGAGNSTGTLNANTPTPPAVSPTSADYSYTNTTTFGTQNGSGSQSQTNSQTVGGQNSSQSQSSSSDP